MLSFDAALMFPVICATTDVNLSVSVSAHSPLRATKAWRVVSRTERFDLGNDMMSRCLVESRLWALFSSLSTFLYLATDQDAFPPNMLTVDRR